MTPLEYQGTNRLLELILLEKSALQRWLQEIEAREAVIRKWIEQDHCAESSALVEATTDLRITK